MDKQKIAYKDPMAAAMIAYWETKDEGLKLEVSTNISTVDYYPVSYFFRTIEDMPLIEQCALNLAQAHVLDVGAGSGVHALALQQMGKQEVTPIDISPFSVELMRKRGLEQAQCQDFFTMPEYRKFDTIIMLMNGLGIVERVGNLPRFFDKAEKLLVDGGQILVDSSNIIYMFEEEDGSALINLNDNYYGEVFFQTVFQGIKGKPYPWLFIDFDNLQMAAKAAGFKAECVMQGEHYDYLARITKII